jgi:acetyl esterase/lipase
MEILAYILSGLSLLMAAMFLVKPRVSIGFLLVWFPLIAGALSLFWAILGVAGTVIGAFYGAFWTIPIGVSGALVMIVYILRCARDQKGFEKAFGSSWKDRILPEQVSLMVRRRWTWHLKMKTPMEPVWDRDLPFWTIPGTDRELLCDLWRPGGGKVSGLTFIYLHGSGWAALDKDVGTRPFFRHLVSQGHTVMDVAYRLIPETDIYGMIGDAKRAVAWIREHAERYGVDPEKIVLAGGSAGAHIALLVGYTPEHPELNPEDLKEKDLSVCGLVSYYGPIDLVAGFHHYKLKPQPPVPMGTRVEGRDAFRNTGRFDLLLGGTPDEVPDMFKLACPTTHIHPGSPPTLLVQGEKDFLVPLEGTLQHYAKLVELGVPAIKVTFPWTDHAFDLLFPGWAPAAQSALYHVDRFLALMANKE